MMRWIGLAMLLLGLGSCGTVSFLGLMFAEPPIEASYLVVPSGPPGTYRLGPIPGDGAQVLLTDIPLGQGCRLEIRDRDGRVLVRNSAVRANSGDGCPVSLDALSPGGTYDVQVEPLSARLRVWQSHGDGLPHLKWWLGLAASLIVTGLVMTLVGFARRRS
jgi:hypothetical protein